MARGMGLQKELEETLGVMHQSPASYCSGVSRIVQKQSKEDAAVSSAIARGIKVIAESMPWGELAAIEIAAVKETVLAAGSVAKHGRRR